MLSLSATATTVGGTITPGTGSAIYRFNGTPGEAINVTGGTLRQPRARGSSSIRVTPRLAEASFGTGLTATLPVAGSYWLVLEGSESSASSISYSFAISGTAPASVVVQGLDAPQSGTLDAGASVTFTFTIPAGLIYDFNSLDRSFGPVTATLSDPNNKQVFSANASSDEGPFVAVVPGTYTLVLSNGDSSGSEPYNFDMLSLPDSTTALTLGAVTKGTLDPGSTTAVFSFTGAAGQRLFLDSQQSSSQTVEFLLADSSGDTVIKTNPYQYYYYYSDSNGGPVTLTGPGTYYLLVEGESDQAPVNFQFRLTDTSTTPLAFGAPISGSLNPSTATDVYSFTGTAGDRIYFQALNQSGGLAAAPGTSTGQTTSWSRARPTGAASPRRSPRMALTRLWSKATLTMTSRRPTASRRLATSIRSPPWSSARK